MRILHVLDHSLPLHSGYSFRSKNLFQAQRRVGWDLDVITSPKHQESWKGQWEAKEVLENFNHFRTPLSSTSMPVVYELKLISALSRRIREIITDHPPDIIHAHSPVLNALAALRIGKKFRIPVVYEIRAFWEDAGVDHKSYKEWSVKYRVVRALETHVCRKAAQVAVLCHGLKNDLLDRGISIEKMSIIGNGINPSEFRACSPDKEVESTFDLKNKIVLGFLGSFYRYEGLDLLIEAFSLLQGKYQNLRLLLVGGGEMEPILKQKAQDLGMAERVVFPGRIPHDRIPGIYSLIDILVYPRYSMRLTELVTPLKPLEAMAMGKPLIASDVGGHKELIIDNETGLLFKAGDTHALASALEKLMNDKEYRLRLGGKSKEWVIRERSWEKTTAAYQDIYRKCLEAGN